MGSFSTNSRDIKRVQYNDTYSSLLRKYPSANSSMDHYVLNNALDDKTEGKSLTFLFVNEGEDYLYGYYSLFSTSIVYSDEDSGEFLGIPSIELKLFAINEELSGKQYTVPGYGPINFSEILLGSIIDDIYMYSKELIGIQAIVLRSTPRAVNFYLRNGFSHFNPEHMLPFDDFSENCIPLIYVL